MLNACPVRSAADQFAKELHVPSWRLAALFSAAGNWDASLMLVGTACELTLGTASLNSRILHKAEDPSLDVLLSWKAALNVQREEGFSINAGIWAAISLGVKSSSAISDIQVHW